MKKLMDFIKYYTLTAEHEKIESKINAVIKETEMVGRYRGMADTLDFLNITPAQWDDIKKNKLKIKLIKNQ